MSTSSANRLHALIERIDAANAQDPTLEQDGTQRIPKELLYGQRMSAMLQAFQPEASVTAQIAVRAQHICRWQLPRTDFPLDRSGYHQWRRALYAFHADTVAALMQQCGFDESTITQVKRSVAKRGIKQEAESQLVEDVAALVFLQHYLAGFHATHPEYDAAKWRDIIGRTWRKMSPQGQCFALEKLTLTQALKQLVVDAIRADDQAATAVH